MAFMIIKSVIIQSKIIQLKKKAFLIITGSSEHTIAHFPCTAFTEINSTMGQSVHAGDVSSNSEQEQIFLYSEQSKDYDIWNLSHAPMNIGEKEVKLSHVAEIEKGQSPQNIYKNNQQYRLCIQYEYIGASEQGQKVLEEAVNSFKKQLPMGYTVENESGGN